MAHSQEAADALTDEVKDLVKDLQDQNKNLEKEVKSMTTYIIELKQQMDDMHDRFYDV
jgi:predicted RNase H-like nuclease (RuvC/YqgF family)